MRSIFIIGSALLCAAPAFAQINSGGAGTSTPTTGDVSAGTTSSGTSGAGTVGTSGTADASAGDGGTATTSGDARFNTANNTARNRMMATANDEDERARSRAMTNVTPNGDVRSRSMSIYKQKGSKPVITRESTVNGQPK